MLARIGYKPKNLIKVQAILVLKLPNNVKKLRHFLGIYTLPCEQSVATCWPLSQKEICGKMRTTHHHKVKKKTLAVGLESLNSI
jgi:hypothetical protein